MNYWIKTNTDGLVSEAPLTEAKDGYTEVDVPVTSAQYFTRYWQAYRYDGSKLLAPANLPNLDIDALRTVVDQQQKQIETQSDTIGNLTNDLKSATGTIKQLQQLTQTENTQQLTTQATIKQLQQLAVSLNQQTLTLQQKIDALTPSK